MKLKVLAALLVSTAAIASPGAPALADAAAAASTCYTISDPDARAYCRAKATQEVATCYAIKRPDYRAMCLAEVRK